MTILWGGWKVEHVKWWWVLCAEYMQQRPREEVCLTSSHSHRRQEEPMWSRTHFSFKDRDKARVGIGVHQWNELGVGVEAPAQTSQTKKVCGPSMKVGPGQGSATYQLGHWLPQLSISVGHHCPDKEGRGGRQKEGQEWGPVKDILDLKMEGVWVWNLGWIQ